MRSRRRASTSTATCVRQVAAATWALMKSMTGNAFPVTGMLDTFNRPNSNNLGANWAGRRAAFCHRRQCLAGYGSQPFDRALERPELRPEPGGLLHLHRHCSECTRSRPVAQAQWEQRGVNQHVDDQRQLRSAPPGQGNVQIWTHQGSQAGACGPSSLVLSSTSATNWAHARWRTAQSTSTATAFCWGLPMRPVARIRCGRRAWRLAVDRYLSIVSPANGARMDNFGGGDVPLVFVQVAAERAT